MNEPHCKENPIRLEDYAAVIGIDWADRKHALATVRAPFDEGCLQGVEHSELAQKPEALHDWIGALQRRFGGRKIAVVLEQRKGALIYFLSAFEFIDIIPVEPVSSKNYRATFYPSGAQSDPVDAELLCEMFLKHHDRLRCHRPQGVEVRQCAQYCADRRRLVDGRARAVQQLKDALKLYYPVVLELFEQLERPLVCAFLKKWPALEALQRARPGTLRQFFYRHGSRNAKRIEGRLAAIAAARPLTADAGVIEPMALRAGCLADQIANLNTLIARYEKQIARLFKRLDKERVFESLPGAGAQLAPRLAVLFGEDRGRFESAAELQLLAGAAPVTRQSGKKKIVQMRWACSTFQRQSVVEFAKASIRFSLWARAFYQMHLPAEPDADRPTYTILRKLAFKWLRIIYQCWKTRTPYNEARYIESLRQSNSPVWRQIQKMKAEGQSLPQLGTAT